MWISCLSWVWPSDCLPPEDGPAGRTGLETGSSLSVCGGQERKTDQAMGADRAGSGWWAKPRVSRVRNWQLPVLANTGLRGPSRRKVPTEKVSAGQYQASSKAGIQAQWTSGPSEGVLQALRKESGHNTSKAPRAQAQGHATHRHSVLRQSMTWGPGLRNQTQSQLSAEVKRSILAGTDWGWGCWGWAGAAGGG